ncbi:MAG: P-type E1-E2 ATPase [Sulfurimonas sp.]|jgi:P-type E1-E2 ATPase|uniref:HAD family hydrolase n=1 Tax=Sulfurimonas sp. TaxID=2022749 RepID=UPI0039E5FC17
MKYLNISIPNFKELTLRHVVLDYNGTLAKDGILKVQVKERLKTLSKLLNVHVITSDTFGNVQSQLKDFKLKINVLCSDDHTLEKATYVKELGAETCFAVGNGNNDAQMLKDAAVSIAIIGDEGCSTKALISSDIVCKEISDALDLLLNKNRLIASLRQ